MKVREYSSSIIRNASFQSFTNNIRLNNAEFVTAHTTTLYKTPKELLI